MRTLHRIFYGIVFFIVSAGSLNAVPAVGHKPWTIFVYIAGDNSLAPYMQQNLDEMVAGFNGNAHVVVFQSSSSKAEGKWSKKLYVDKNGMQQDGATMMNLDSGSVAVAQEAALWAVENFPSDKFCIVFWDHGSGTLNPARSRNGMPLYRGVCFDDTTDNYLNDYDLRTILTAIGQKRGKKTEIVAFDACLMAALEVAVTIADLADYLVSSEETIGALGYNYEFVLNSIKNKDLDAGSFAKCMIDSYDHFYHNRSGGYTLSAVDLSQLVPLVNNLNQVVEYLEHLIKTDGSRVVAKTIFQAGVNPLTIRFDDYADLASFYATLDTAISSMKISNDAAKRLQSMINCGFYALRTAVIAKVNSINFAGCGGLSLYLPPHRIDKTYADLYWSKVVPSWLGLLKLLKKG